MELKLQYGLSKHQAKKSLNRTFMELKYIRNLVGSATDVS